MLGPGKQAGGWEDGNGSDREHVESGVDLK